MREWDGQLVSPRHRRRWPRPPHFVLAATVLVVLLLCLPLSWQHANASTASAPAASAPAASAPAASASATSLLAPPSEGLRLARHLIVVACHAVYTAEDHGHAALQRETSWFLEPFQHGQLETMLEHIKRGVELAAADNRSVVLFSGGHTRAEAGPRSEALSYWEVAEAEGWFGHPHARARAHLEEQARDSFENVLFSICRFNELVGSYPTRITFVSFDFKRRRFESLHREALRFPSRRFEFVGIDPPGLSESVVTAERTQSARPFESDPYGCSEPVLLRKRIERNPFRHSISYPQGCPELRALISECHSQIYSGALPWSLPAESLLFTL